MSDWQDELAQAIDQRFDQMVELRRHLHRNPEVSGDEHQTSMHLYQLLDEAGLNVRLGPEGRGVIADLNAPNNGARGGIFAIRADIDALHIQDEKQVDYASTVPGVMHACGHDAHTAMATGALLTLARLQESGACPRRSVRGIFQPAEETCEGARHMIEAGALDNVEAIIATHVDPSRRLGTVGLRSGVFTAVCDDMRVTVHGRGGHAARPHEAHDPISAAAQFINWLYLQIPRATDSQDSVVITIGQVQGGHTCNVIPEEVELRGTMRTLDPEVRRRTMQRIREIATAVAGGSRTEIDVQFTLGSEAVVNDNDLTQLLRDAASTILPPDQVETIERPSMGGEDFSFYTSQVPGAMWRLGCTSDKTGMTTLHTPLFDIDERAMQIGARMFAAAAIRWWEVTKTST